MGNTIIKVENLSKQYRLGSIGTGTLSSDLNRWWANFRGKEDPFALIGEVNDRTVKGNSEYVWALKNINFEVKQGEVLGIIGRNGAGKSTLLKILSRVTTPSEGRVKMKGRISSLLEVGTGFHPELTGKENIFLNGSILGMTKREIKSKLDEIVDFSGVEKYVDTPVKRYSSGMYVRLAFAVAAFLEPEVLIVDEVLAVGDAEFQKKCLGKLGNLSKGEGRTVLFVSHNMTSMNSLCDSVIYLKNGELVQRGEASSIINKYISEGADINTHKKWKENESPGDEVVKLLEARLVDNAGNKADSLDFYKGGGIEFTYIILKDGYRPVPNMFLHNQQGDHVFASLATNEAPYTKIGVYKTTMQIPPNLLNDGRYIATLATSTMVPEKIHFSEKDALIFDVIENMNLRENDYRMAIPGVIRPKLNWDIEKIA